MRRTRLRCSICRNAKPDDARNRYEKILVRDPKNEDMLLAVAELVATTGQGPDQVKAAIERAVTANPASVRPRIALINYYSRIRDAKAALAAADAARGAFPNDSQVLESLGVAQMMAGERAKAIDTFRQLVQLQPQNATALMRLADAQTGMKDYNCRDRHASQSDRDPTRSDSSLGRAGEGLRPVRPPGRRNRRGPQASEAAPGSRARFCNRSRSARRPKEVGRSGTTLSRRDRAPACANPRGRRL